MSVDVPRNLMLPKLGKCAVFFFRRCRADDDLHGFGASAESPKVATARNEWNAVYRVYPLVNVYITMERSAILNGKTHYFYGHYP